MTSYLHPWYFDAANAIRELADAGQPFTVEDVERLAPPAPHYNCYGQAMKTAEQGGHIKKTGRWVQSAKPSRRKARIAQWIGAGFPLPVEPVEESRPAQGAMAL